MSQNEKRPGTWKSLIRSLRSWRTASVALLSFSSGMPLGLVWIAVPDWMHSIGVDIKTVGLLTLAQAPWTFKFLWSPLMDRYAPGSLGRRRGWMLITQVALLVFTAALGWVHNDPNTPWVVAAICLAIAFASASQDIAYDAYTVEVLRPEEQGVAVGARTALYRAAMYLAGGVSITMAGKFGWPVVTALLALLYLPMMAITWRAPEPEERVVPPRSLRDAVWQPFLGFLSRHRALEILAFVLTYKLGENLALALLRPFLIDMGYDATDRGVALATIYTLAILTGAFAGGALSTVWGLGRALWIFGVLQVFANLGYVLLAGTPVNRPLMYGTMGFEGLINGLATGAFSVLLLRLTQKRFSATQYALLSSMFGLPRLVAGPLSGFLVDAMGWRDFFWLSMAFGLPGLLLLSRFVPLGVREPNFSIEPPRPGAPLSSQALVLRGIVGFLGGALCAAFLQALLTALKAMHTKAGEAAHPFDLAAQFQAIFHPQGPGDWLVLAGILAVGCVCGLLAAAVAAARHGAGAEETA